MVSELRSWKERKDGRVEVAFGLLRSVHAADLSLLVRMILLAVGAGNGYWHADSNRALSPILIRKKKNLLAA